MRSLREVTELAVAHLLDQRGQSQVLLTTFQVLKHVEEASVEPEQGRLTADEARAVDDEARVPYQEQVIGAVLRKRGLMHVANANGGEGAYVRFEQLSLDLQADAIRQEVRAGGARLAKARRLALVTNPLRQAKGLTPLDINELIKEEERRAAEAEAAKP